MHALARLRCGKLACRLREPQTRTARTDVAITCYIGVLWLQAPQCPLVYSSMLHRMSERAGGHPKREKVASDEVGFA